MVFKLLIVLFVHIKTKLSAFMDKNNNIYIKTGLGIAAFCVILGAFASHMLKELLNEADLNTFDTGTKYLFYHALGIITISLSHRKFNQNILDLVIFLFLGGMVFFTGSLYLLATRTIWGDESFVWLGAITPVGGVMFISGWLLLLVKGLKNTEQQVNDKDSAHKTKHRHRKHRRSSSKSTTEKSVEISLNN